MLFSCVKTYILLVIKLHIRSNIINYLRDENYVVCFYDDNVYIYKYGELKSFSEDTACFKILHNVVITIRGLNLTILKITKEEVLVGGTIKSIEKVVSNE